MSLVLQYDGRDNNPQLLGWTLTQYGVGGDRKDAWKGRIRGLDFNGDVDDSRFSVKFPIGTHVAKEAGGKFSYYIQEKDGLKPIDAEEFGRQDEAGLQKGARR